MAKASGKPEASTMGRSARASGPAPVALPASSTREERRAAGKALRASCHRASHAAWKPSPARRDPVELVLAAEKGRMADLLPLRHGRMVRSPFSFYRGAALTMAADLATTPTTGIRVQCCGDAHLCNFGGFGTPERRVIFSINDLDETLPGPWEWDLKRLAASLVVASRDRSLGEGAGRDAVLACVRAYREAMAEFGELPTLELWQRSLGPDNLPGMDDPGIRDRVLKRLEKERAKSAAAELFPKLVERRGERPVIRDQLPTIFHAKGHPPGEVQRSVLEAFAAYRATLPTSYQALLDRFELRDAAIKVVGVGSVGTACWVLLFMAGEDDPLFLQVKEARASVLEPYAGASPFPNHGQRVVNGYRLMQPFSDPFLGWTRGPRRDFFIRQLRDIKVSPRVETFGASLMALYGSWCGKALALAHARSGQASLLAGYLGGGDTLDEAIAAFSKAYADQNEKDHAAFARAVRKGTVKAVLEEA